MDGKYSSFLLLILCAFGASYCCAERRISGESSLRWPSLEHAQAAYHVGALKQIILDVVKENDGYIPHSLKVRIPNSLVSCRYPGGQTYMVLIAYDGFITSLKLYCESERIVHSPILSLALSAHSNTNCLYVEFIGKDWLAAAYAPIPSGLLFSLVESFFVPPIMTNHKCIYATDVAFDLCRSGLEDDIPTPLTPWTLISRGTTFYGKFGFLPTFLFTGVCSEHGHAMRKYERVDPEFLSEYCQKLQIMLTAGRYTIEIIDGMHLEDMTELCTESYVALMVRSLLADACGEEELASFGDNVRIPKLSQKALDTVGGCQNITLLGIYKYFKQEGFHFESPEESHMCDLFARLSEDIYRIWTELVLDPMLKAKSRQTALCEDFTDGRSNNIVLLPEGPYAPGGTASACATGAVHGNIAPRGSLCGKNKSYSQKILDWTVAALHTVTGGYFAR